MMLNCVYNVAELSDVVVNAWGNMRNFVLVVNSISSRLPLLLLRPAIMKYSDSDFTVITAISASFHENDMNP